VEWLRNSNNIYEVLLALPFSHAPRRDYGAMEPRKWKKLQEMMDIHGSYTVKPGAFLYIFP